MTNVAGTTSPGAMLGTHRCCNVLFGLHRMERVFVIHGAMDCTVVVFLQRCDLELQLSNRFSPLEHLLGTI